MRIAFIVDAFPVLTETFVLNQITGLMDLGHDVEIFAGVRAIKEMYPPEVEKYGLLKRTYYHNEKPRNIFIRFLKGIRLFVLNIGKNSLVILRSLNFFKYGKDALALTLLYKAVVFLNRGEFDIIQCHFGGNGNVGVLLKELGIKGKVVTIFHGYDLSKYVKKHGKTVYNVLFEKGDIFLPVSNYLKTRLLELGCDEKKILVHHMGIKSEKFPFRMRKVSGGELVKIITVGRLIEKKGIDYGIRAVGNLKGKQLKIEYNIVGDGPLRKDLERLIEELELTGTVKLLGKKPHREVINLLNESHILLAPSVTAKDADQEGIPVVLMEAMAMGLAVVSTYYSGIPELIEEGRTGFLASERNTSAIAEKIEHLIKYPETWIGMSHAGRKFVEEHYDIDKLNKRLVEIYKGALGGNE